MKTTEEPPKKTISATFRISEEVHRAMQEYARTNKISVNTLVNQLLDIWFESDRFMGEVGLVRITAPNFKRFLGAIPDDTLAEAAKLAGKDPSRSYIMARDGKLSLSGALHFVKGFAQYGGYAKYNEIEADGKRVVVLVHEFGRAGSEYISWLALKDGMNAPRYIPVDKLAVLHKAALRACDAKDGVTDGVIEVPKRCSFDPKVTQCSGADGPDCLTATQVETARLIYAGAKYADGKQIFPGFEPGSELGWSGMVAGPEPISIATGFFKYMVFGDPNWDFRTFDVDRDTRVADQKLGSVVNAIDPNLKAFEEHGGRIIMYHGWEDSAIAPGNSVNYRASVVEKMGGVEKTQEFLRLFMVPGMGHCRGGPGPNIFDAMGAMEQWREQNIAPEKIIATHSTGGKVDNSRPLCPYPQAAIYGGNGKTTDAANFSCGNPNW